MILVTGGTGLVGSHLLFSLVADGKKVRAIHRKNSDLNAVKHVFGYYAKDAETYFNKIEWREADITDIPSLTEAFRGITHVYHAAAYVNFDPKNFQKLQKSNVEGTANIVNLCLANSVKKLCYVSSVATFGDTLDKSPITEETHWNPETKNSVYAITKYGAEMEVWRGTQEGLDAVIVNPGIIFGEGFWNAGAGVIINMANSEVPLIVPGSMGFVDVKDVVAAMKLLMEGDYKNERFILVGANMKYQELSTKLARLLGKKPPSKRLPKWVLLSVSFFDKVISRLFKRNQKILATTIESMYTEQRYDASKIKTKLNFEFTHFEETLKRVTSLYCKES